MRAEKKSIAGEIRENVENSDYIVLIDYRGLNVEQLSALRSEFRDTGTRLVIVKNSFFKEAVRNTGREGLGAYCDGPTAMITGKGDITGIVKTLKNFSRENKAATARGGNLGDRMLSAEDIEQIASLPPREALLGLLACTIAAPLRQLPGVLSQKLMSLLYALKDVEKKKSE
ncbi:MAG: 50S ribosomal protein L10 [Kiritimatiellia bacterium]